MELRFGKPPLIPRHNVAAQGLPGDSAWAGPAGEGTQDLRRGSGVKGDGPQHWCCPGELKLTESKMLLSLQFVLESSFVAQYL